MAGLLAPYIPDSSEWFKSAGQGYAQGEAIRNRNLRVDAGGQAAEGDLKGAKATLYEGGDFEGGNQVNQMMRQASDDALKKTEKFHSMLGNLVLSVKSLPAAQQPAAWAKATQAAKGIGLDVSKYEDPSSMDAILAQSGKTMEAIGLEAERRKAAQPDYIGVGKRVFDKRAGKFVGDDTAAGADPELTLEQGKHEQSLRKEYTALSSDMRIIQDSVGKLRTAQKLDSGQGDIAMVYAYMKLLDPPSVVRETEFSIAENAGGFGEKVQIAAQKLLNGERLTSAMREQFVTAGEAVAGDKTERFGKLKSQFEGIARKSGADPSRIMLDEGMAVKKDASQLPADPNARNSPSYSGTVDPRALQMLKGNPTPQTMQQFDEIFGEGAAAKALGR